MKRLGLLVMPRSGLSHPPSKELHPELRAYHSFTLRHTYQQTLAERFQGSSSEWQSMHGSYIHRRKYEEAVAQGYSGSFKMWRLAENVHSTTRRSSGSCPYISTLKRIDRPTATQLIRFTPLARNPGFFQSERWVLKDELDFGRARLSVHAPEVSADEELWLYPYFDSVTKALAFQRPDGTNHPHTKSLPRLAIADGYRPLLYLAQMEGLLDKVPDSRLSSLSFGQVRESGYAVCSPLTRQRIAQCTIRLPSTTQPKFDFLPLIEEDRRSVICFPYIGDDEQLRLWDAEKEEPLFMRCHKGLQEGWDAQTTLKRFPAVFEFAQGLGYWKDVRLTGKQLQ